MFCIAQITINLVCNLKNKYKEANLLKLEKLQTDYR